MLERVYQALGPTDAWMVRDWLERNGIRAVIQGADLISLRGELPVAWPTVWVSGLESARSRELIAEFEGPALVHPEWTCACGEANGAAFGSCWSCGREAP